MTRVYEIVENSTTHYIDLSKITRIHFEDVQNGSMYLRIHFNDDSLVFSSYNGYIGGLPKDSEKGEVIKAWIQKTAGDLIAAWKAYTPHIEYVYQGPPQYGASHPVIYPFSQGGAGKPGRPGEV